MCIALVCFADLPWVELAVLYAIIALVRSGGVCGVAGGHCLVSCYLPLTMSAVAIKGAAFIL